MVDLRTYRHAHGTREGGRAALALSTRGRVMRVGNIPALKRRFSQSIYAVGRRSRPPPYRWKPGPRPFASTRRACCTSTPRPSRGGLTNPSCRVDPRLPLRLTEVRRSKQASQKTLIVRRKQDNPSPHGGDIQVCESVRAPHLGRSESPISDSASDRKAPRRLNATVPPVV
jgi:hypothetical protein